MSKWLVWAYAGILLVYTGWRTFDFMQSNLPKSDISFWLSIAFLFATEAGLLLWHGLNLQSVTTENQDRVSTVMTWVDFVGSLAAGIADMILRQTFIDGYEIPPALAQFLIFGLPAIMGLNVGAVIVYTSNDAKTLEAKAEKALRFKIHQAAMEELERDRDAIAEEKKLAIYSKMRAGVTGRIDNQYGQPVAYPVAKRERRPSLLGQLARRWTRGLSDRLNNYLTEGQPESGRVMVYPAESEAAHADPPQLPQNGRE